MDLDEKALDSDSKTKDKASKAPHPDPEPLEPPPAYEQVVEDPPKYKIEPSVLVLDGESIHDEASPKTPLYRLSRKVTIVIPNKSSIKFERIEHVPPQKDESTARPTERRHHMFYLVHPSNARYRTDVHPYYMTAKKPSMLGNVRLEAATSRLQKTEFKALLSAGRSAADDPLFDENDGKKVLFSAKPRWMGGRCNWTDTKGKELAFEDGKGEKPRLIITTAMEVDVRDALVAIWCLKVWRDTNETLAAKMDGKLAFTVPHGDANHQCQNSSSRRRKTRMQIGV